MWKNAPPPRNFKFEKKLINAIKHDNLDLFVHHQYEKRQTVHSYVRDAVDACYYLYNEYTKQIKQFVSLTCEKMCKNNDNSKLIDEFLWLMADKYSHQRELPKIIIENIIKYYGIHTIEESIKISYIYCWDILTIIVPHYVSYTRYKELLGYFQVYNPKILEEFLKNGLDLYRTDLSSAGLPLYFHLTCRENWRTIDCVKVMVKYGLNVFRKHDGKLLIDFVHYNGTKKYLASVMFDRISQTIPLNDNLLESMREQYINLYSY